MEHKKPPEGNTEDSEIQLKKSPEYKRFRALLRNVVKAPPMRRHKTSDVGPHSEQENHGT